MGILLTEYDFYGVGRPVTLNSANPTHRPHNGQIAIIRTKVEGDGLTIYGVELQNSTRLAVAKTDIIPLDD